MKSNALILFLGSDHLLECVSLSRFELPDCTPTLPMTRQASASASLYSERISALRGASVPASLNTYATKLCVVRGIRLHPGFATELRGTRPIFTRALNARAIMSNEIPDMDEHIPNEFPYCIWYPEVASEETYRELARRYPRLKYPVGRACAVAGYVNLFHELDLLPEVHIAEDARNTGNEAIFDSIMASPVKYEVMNDYDRSIRNTPRVASLNNDTAVRSSLDVRRNLRSSYPGKLHERSYFRATFNITEDYCVDETASPERKRNPKLAQSLLYTPLPSDLPDIDKHLLIIMAAYYGDVDRYSRLRRPNSVAHELPCVIHGIYTNTLFAKWWSLQLPVKNENCDDEDPGEPSIPESSAPDDAGDPDIQSPINKLGDNGMVSCSILCPSSHSLSHKSSELATDYPDVSTSNDKTNKESAEEDDSDESDLYSEGGGEDRSMSDREYDYGPHEPDDDSDNDDDPWYDVIDIYQAINARFIMINNLSRITEKTSKYDIPYNIWYPLTPLPGTLRELLRLRPETKPQVARACVVADYQKLYTKLDPDADSLLMAEAERSPNEYYRNDLRKKTEEGRGDHRRRPDVEKDWHIGTMYDSTPEGTTEVQEDLGTESLILDDYCPSLFQGYRVDPSLIEYNLCRSGEHQTRPSEALRASQHS
jgi:hypothetical protein